MKMHMDNNHYKSGARRFLCQFSVVFSALVFLALSSYAQDDMITFIGKKQKEIKEKENILLKEEERLKVLRKDLDDRIEKYATLLNQIENVLKKLESVQDEKFDHIVKVYETMPPEEAATRLAALSEPTAIKIIRKMKPKKSGTIMAFMPPNKVASITEGMTKFEKNFPTQ